MWAIVSSLLQSLYMKLIFSPIYGLILKTYLVGLWSTLSGAVVAFLRFWRCLKCSYLLIFSLLTYSNDDSSTRKEDVDVVTLPQCTLAVGIRRAAPSRRHLRASTSRTYSTTLTTCFKDSRKSSMKCWRFKTSHDVRNYTQSYRLEALMLVL